MKERCRDGCRTSLLIAGVVLVPAIFHTLLPPCHPYITIHFMEMIFSTCILTNMEIFWNVKHDSNTSNHPCRERRYNPLRGEAPFGGTAPLSNKHLQAIISTYNLCFSLGRHTCCIRLQFCGDKSYLSLKQLIAWPGCWRTLSHLKH